MSAWDETTCCDKHKDLNGDDGLPCEDAPRRTTKTPDPVCARCLRPTLPGLIDDDLCPACSVAAHRPKVTT